jgi:23S rRNA (uracil1939-C5)-methyltransferase
MTLSVPPGLCPHFGDCGGCASQDVPYAAQLAAKDALVRETLAPFSPGELRPILPSPDVFHYRNKMEFAFGGLKDEPPLLGLRRKGRFDRVVDLAECRLLSPEAGPLLAAVRRWATAEKLPTYHLKSHKGFLRYLVVREGKNTGRRMVHLVTAAGEAPKASFLQALDDSGVRVDTAVWSVNAGLSDLARGESSAVWRGDGTITEALEGKPYVITPEGFFQTNTRGAERLYGVVRDFVGSRVDALVDFYCGAGSIGLFCADRAGRVLGVELHAPSVQSARANAKLQGVSHAEFVAADAAAFARDPGLLALWGHPGTLAVMDPPRPGLAPEVRRLLVERPVSRWVYVSCNPKALSGDLAHLCSVYSVEAAQPVDLFPHTPHVETAVLLRKK